MAGRTANFESLLNLLIGISIEQSNGRVAVADKRAMMNQLEDRGIRSLCDFEVRRRARAEQARRA